MSFILDALQKLEEKRHNESAPDLMTNHRDGHREPGKRPILTYLIVAVLLLNAVVLAVWLRPQQEESNSFIAQAAKENIKTPAPAVPKSNEAVIKKEAPQRQETVEASTPAIPNTNKAVVKNEPPQRQEVVNAPVPDIVGTENREAAIETASLPIEPSPEEIRDLKSKIAEEQFFVDTSPSLEPALEEESASIGERSVLDIDQLPLSTRKELPDLTVTGHIYSNNPMSRVVNINGDVIREGDTVTSGLKVDEITMSGVVFDYEGVLFSVRAF